jgi:hypothetical protein
MNTLLLFLIGLLLFYLLSNKIEYYENNTLNQQLLEFLKKNKDINYITYAQFLNSRKNTNLNLIQISTFNKLIELGQNLTIEDINKFS